MAWGKDWNTGVRKINLDNGTWPLEAAPISYKAWAADLASGILITNKADTLKIEHIETAKVYLNKVPTHDPYTNPNSHIYYECACGDILDPGTKSFAALNGVASDKGWKIRFGPMHYIPYCVKCGKDVE